MAAKVTITFTKGWVKLSELLKPGKIDANLKAQVGRATRVNAMIARREIRKNMKNAKYSKGRAKNSDLTVFIKGSDKTLVDKGELFKGITSVVLTPFTAEVGFIRGSPKANIGVAIHQGATIKVSPAMRGMFAALAAASDGRMDPSKLTGRAKELWERRPKTGWKALKPSTTAIKIPPRPFIQEVMENAGLRALMAKNWTNAAAAAIAGKKAVLKTGF